MLISMHKELERGFKLVNEGKLEEALQVIIDFEKSKELTPEDKHYFRTIKGWIIFQMGKLPESLIIAEQDYQESKTQNKILFLIDSICLRFFILFMIGGNIKAGEAREDVLSSERLLKSITQEPSIEINLRKGFIIYMKGYYSYWEGSLDKAIKQFKKSLAIFENYELHSSVYTPSNLHILGMAYEAKGELDLALDSHKKSLDLYKASTITTNITKGITYSSIGNIYFQKGDLDQAIGYYEKNLKIMDQNTLWPAIFWVGASYDRLIKVLIYKDSLKEAQECLEQFFQYLEKKKISKNYHWYRLSEARVLASSSRVRDRAKAEDIAKKILEDGPNSGIYIRTLSKLCELYFQELKTSKDLEILEDIQPLVDKLIEESEQSNSFSLRSYALLLKGKISLLRLNMGDARRYLTEAQQIADSNSLQRLARAISHEHDQMMEQLDGLESYKKKKMTTSERINLASLDDTLDLIQGRRAANAPDLIDEEPVLLLILSEGGILMFSYPFTDELKVEDELFGGFLSAITSFSDEVFSEGLDRAKFGSYTVLMNNIGDFSFCYVLKGQTYLAQKKLSNFTENFQKNTSMMQTLNKFNQTSQVIDIKDFPFLEGFIKGIFTNN
jgi:tetratricopeptide (TPR) repeat protein